MSIRLPAPVLLSPQGSRCARSLLALGAIALIVSAATPAVAVEGFKPGRLSSLKAAKAPSARALRKAGTSAGPGLQGRDRPSTRTAKPRRPHLPPLAIPLPPAGSDPGLLPHRAERAVAPPAQSQSVPRQLVIVLDHNQGNDVSDELALRHGL